MRTKIFAHRGSKGTHPENTMSAFKEALRIGADGVEFDVQLTKDNQVVVIHDETVDRTTTGTGYVKDYTLAELQQLDAGIKFDSAFIGERIPTLEEVLALYQPTSFLINIELKNDLFRYEGMEEKVIAFVRQYQLEDRVILSSFNHDCIAYLQTLNTSIELALLYDTYDEQVIIDMNNKEQTSFHPNGSLLTKEIIEEAHKHQLTIRTYTINKVEDMLTAYHLGVDAIFTDFPEQALQIARATDHA